MKLEQFFEQAHRLPSAPKVVQELITSLGKPDIAISDIAARIALDQVIAAKTLRLANSAQIAAAHRIGSINEAAMILGTSTLRTLVIASGISGAFISTPGFDRKRFWLYSLDVASSARLIARLADQDQETAFTCGLVHNIGELLIHVVMPELAFHIDRSVDKGADRITLEENSIGFDYIDAGAELVRRWSFPEIFHLAIRHQRFPLRHPECGTLGLILHLAIRISQLREHKALNEITAEDLPAAVLVALGLQADPLIGELPKIQIAAHEQASLLDT